MKLPNISQNQNKVCFVYGFALKLSTKIRNNKLDLKHNFVQICYN